MIEKVIEVLRNALSAFRKGDDPAAVRRGIEEAIAILEKGGADNG